MPATDTLTDGISINGMILRRIDDNRIAFGGSEYDCGGYPPIDGYRDYGYTWYQTYSRIGEQQEEDDLPDEILLGWVARSGWRWDDYDHEDAVESWDSPEWIDFDRGRAWGDLPPNMYDVSTLDQSVACRGRDALAAEVRRIAVDMIDDLLHDDWGADMMRLAWYEETEYDPIAADVQMRVCRGAAEHVRESLLALDSEDLAKILGIGVSLLLDDGWDDLVLMDTRLRDEGIRAAFRKAAWEAATADWGDSTNEDWCMIFRQASEGREPWTTTDGEEEWRYADSPLVAGRMYAQWFTEHNA